MPVIVLSAQNTLDTAVRASESEAFEYFPKPFDLDELVHAVRQAAARGPRSTTRVVPLCLGVKAKRCRWSAVARPCRASTG